MTNHYKSMLRGKFRNAGGWRCKPSRDWLALYPPGTGEHFDRTHWKFHLSVAGDDVPKAWNVLVDALMAGDERRHAAKVVVPEGISSMTNPLQSRFYTGKTITLYPGEDAPADGTLRLLTEVEKRLAAAGVRPGPQIEADRHVPGSRYVSYVCEDGNDSLGRRQYNPCGKPDPYLSFTMPPFPLGQRKQIPLSLAGLRKLVPSFARRSV